MSAANARRMSVNFAIRDLERSPSIIIVVPSDLVEQPRSPRTGQEVGFLSRRHSPHSRADQADAFRDSRRKFHFSRFLLQFQKLDCELHQGLTDRLN